jgi:hypothetical protein
MGDVIEMKRKPASQRAAPTPDPKRAITAQPRTDGLVDVTITLTKRDGELVYAQVLMTPDDALEFRASLSDAILDAYAEPGDDAPEGES